MVGIVVKPSISIESVDSNFDVSKINHALDDVSKLYPDFQSWFRNKFIPSFNVGERSILVAHNGNELCGVSLLKKTLEEDKICTFYVLPEFRGQKLGEALLDRSLEYFSTPDVVISVSKERVEELYPVLRSRGFQLESCIEDLYRKGNKEHFYKNK